MEAFFVGQVKHQDTRVYPFKIRARDSAKSLLAGCIPHLQLHFVSGDEDRFADEIDSDCRITLGLEVSEIEAKHD